MTISFSCSHTASKSPPFSFTHHKLYRSHLVILRPSHDHATRASASRIRPFCIPAYQGGITDKIVDMPCQARVRCDAHSEESEASSPRRPLPGRQSVDPAPGSCSARALGATTAFSPTGDLNLASIAVDLGDLDVRHQLWSWIAGDPFTESWACSSEMEMWCCADRSNRCSKLLFLCCFRLRFQAA
jgi:hypothetical protein